MTSAVWSHAGFCCLLLFTLFTAEETGYDVSCVISCRVQLFTVIYIVYFRGNWLWCQLRDLVSGAADAGPRVSHTAGLCLTRAAGVGGDGTPLPATKPSGAGSWQWTGQLLGLVWWWVVFTVAQAWTEVPGSFDCWFGFLIGSGVQWSAGTNRGLALRKLWHLLCLSSLMVSGIHSGTGMNRSPRGSGSWFDLFNGVAFTRVLAQTEVLCVCVCVSAHVWVYACVWMCLCQSVSTCYEFVCSCLYVCLRVHRLQCSCCSWTAWGSCCSSSHHA